MGLSSDAPASSKMTYRFLGNSGLLVSKLGLGTYMSDETKYQGDFWYELMTLAYSHGVNFFDCAEAYGNGKAEVMLGKAIKRGIAAGVRATRPGRTPRGWLASTLSKAPRRRSSGSS